MALHLDTCVLRHITLLFKKEPLAVLESSTRLMKSAKTPKNSVALLSAVLSRSVVTDRVAGDWFLLESIPPGLNMPPDLPPGAKASWLGILCIGLGGASSLSSCLRLSHPILGSGDHGTNLEKSSVAVLLDRHVMVPIIDRPSSILPPGALEKGVEGSSHTCFQVTQAKSCEQSHRNYGGVAVAKRSIQGCFHNEECRFPITTEGNLDEQRATWMQYQGLQRLNRSGSHLIIIPEGSSAA